ncbi:MAG: FecR domain-containing protein [Candidatus Omnitrophica bacterium]|jgi:hypothetical protein|nr:FecR domain-containing protein [Candidatus Omnitrophota bacterium]
MRIAKVITSLLIIQIFALPSFCEEVKRSAKIIYCKGKVEVRPAGKDFVPAKKGMILNEGDIIKTNLKSSATLNLNGKGETATVEIKEGSQLMLAELIQDKEKQTQNTLLDLAIGKVLIKAKELHDENSKFEVKTPTSVVGVRGTTFAVEVEALK